VRLATDPDHVRLGQAAGTTGRTAMDRNNQEGSFWASVAAVLVLTFVIGGLYLPLFV